MYNNTMIYEIIIIALCAISPLFISMLTRNKSVKIYSATFLYWIVGYFLLYKITDINSINELIEIIFATNLFLIFLKPLATYITGILKNRKIWIYISIAVISVLLILITFININISIYLKVFMYVCLAFCLANQSLFYLLLNEQVYYAKEPVKSSFSIAVIINSALVISFLLFTYFNDEKYNNIIMFISLLLCIFVSLFFLLITKESKDNFILIDNSLLTNQEKYKSRTIYIIIAVSLFLGFIYGFYASSYYSNLFNIDLNMLIYLIIPISFSYFFYKYILLKFDFYNICLLLLTIISLNTIINLFVTNKIFIYYVLLANGFCLYSLYFIVFGMAIMWNYKVSRRPITGFCAGGFILGNYIFSLTRYFTKEFDGLVYSDADFNFKLYILLVIVSILSLFVFFSYFKRDIFGQYTKSTENSNTNLSSK